MNVEPGRHSLDREHTPAAIRARLESATAHSYLRDFVLGAVDGTITTFAVVAGSAGANLGGQVAIVLGLANLVADGFSMAVGNYLAAKTSQEIVEQARRMEEAHIDAIPEGEREEIRQIFAGKGFEGVVLEEIVAVITRDRRRWVDTMLTDELGLPLETPRAWRAGLATFSAFALAGLIPLLPYLFNAGWTQSQTFGVSAAATAVTFVLIGLFKGRLLGRPLWSSGLETLAVGGTAAAMAYLVGVWLKGFGG